MLKKIPRRVLRAIKSLESCTGLNIFPPTLDENGKLKSDLQIKNKAAVFNLFSDAYRIPSNCNDKEVISAINEVGDLL